MSGDYLLLAWSAADEAAWAQARARSEPLLQLGWTRQVARPGLAVWVRSERPLQVQARAPGAVIIGRALPRPRPPPGRTASVGQDSGAAAAQAAQLCRELWGGYVALVPSTADGGAWLFRDPSGALDALVWRCGDLTVAASDLDAVPPSLTPDEIALDWDVIADFLRRPAALAGRCALSGVASIAPGALQPLGRDQHGPVEVWRPRDWAAAGGELGLRPRPGSEPLRLRRTILEVVGALAAQYEVIAAEVSGGLDSGVVAAAIGAEGFGARTVAALHYRGDLPESDERRWAQLLCDRWRLPLTCVGRELQPFDPEQDLEPLAGGARPPVAALDGWRDRDAAVRLRASGAQALFTGVGGDAVLFQMPTSAVLADLFAERGLKGLADPLVRDLARRLRRSVWSVAAEGLASVRRPDRQAPPPDLLGARARHAPRGEAHPWLADVADLPPAKRLQIGALAALQGLLGRSRRTDAAEVVHPLLSQPVMELCLAIPAWLHVEGGRDRALARAAMTPLAPAEFLARRSKGDLTSHFARRLAASEAMKPYLLDGALVRAEVLDARAVERALDPDTLIRRSDGLALITAAAVEAWVRYWQARVPDARAARRR